MPLARWGRRKRWDHWALVTPEHVLALTFADLDYLGLATAALYDRARDRWVQRAGVTPLGWRAQLPHDAAGGSFAVRSAGLDFSVARTASGWSIRASGWGFEATLEAEVPEGYESLDLFARWDEERWQYTSKQLALPARATVRVGGERVRLGERERAFAARDFGRGVWPFRTRWNWACGAGVAGGATRGFNLGAQWTDGTGVSENALLDGGVLHKVHGPGRFRWDRAQPRAPWELTAGTQEEAKLTLRPFAHQRVRVPGLLALDLCFGAFGGSVLGRSVDGTLGWAEEFSARW